METKIKKPFYKKWWLWVIVIIVIVVAIGSGGGSDKKTANTNSNKSATTVENTKKEEGTKITYENFLKIKMGAKLADVEAILGKGTEESSSELGGIKTAMYSWNGQGISNMNVTIQNDVVTGKAQLGLDSTDAKVTLEKYNQVKEGMSYDQVKGILGEGQIMSQTKLMDIESTMYSWINSDGSNMNCTFSGGKMALKAQFNLK